MKVHDYRERRSERVVLEDHEIGQCLKMIVLNSDSINKGDRIRIDYGGEDCSYRVTEVMRQIPGRYWVRAEFVGGVR